MKFANLMKYLDIYVLPLYPINKMKNNMRYSITNPNENSYRIESEVVSVIITTAFDKVSIIGTHSSESYPIHMYFDMGQEVPSVLPINGWSTIYDIIYDIIVELIYDLIREGMSHS